MRLSWGLHGSQIWLYHPRMCQSLCPWMSVGQMCIISMWSRGPSMLPWGTPEWIWKLLEVSLLYLVTKWRSCRYDFSKLKYLAGRIFFNFVE